MSVKRNCLYADVDIWQFLVPLVKVAFSHTFLNRPMSHLVVFRVCQLSVVILLAVVYQHGPVSSFYSVHDAEDQSSQEVHIEGQTSDQQHPTYLVISQ
jgi:hypothetical protein